MKRNEVYEPERQTTYIIIITLLLNCQLTFLTKWYYNTHRVQVVIYLPKADEPFMTDSKVN